jgi:hypothetical protein
LADAKRLGCNRIEFEMKRKHPVFGGAAQRTVLWRYMDFTKLVSIFETESLYFSRADRLGDPFEGSLPLEEFRKDPNQYLAPVSVLEHGFVAKNMLDFYRHQVYLHCWCASEHESDALWKIYGKGAEGCAIRTTFGRLRRCLDAQSKYDVLAGRVRYIDYQCEEFRPLSDGSKNILQQFAYKRKSHAHEREVRAAVLQSHAEKGVASKYGKVHLLDLDAYRNTLGIGVAVDPTKLIKSIHVAPGAAPWFLKLVSELITKRYKLQIPVRQSSLDNPAII